MDIENTAPKSISVQSDVEPGFSPMPLDNGSEHPSVRIPFRAIIDGRQYTGSSISLVNAHVAGLSGPELDGQKRLAVLRFDFSGYAITLPVEARIARAQSETGEMRLDFTHPTGDHLPALRYLLNSYIAGDIMSVDRIIGLRDKASGQEARKGAAASGIGGGARRFARFLATSVLTLALAGIVASLAYTRIFSHEVPQLGMVAGNGEVLRAVASGQISYLNTAAAKGDVVYSLRSNSGDTLNVTMPCDCKVLPGKIAEGATVLAGDPVVEAVSGNVEPVVDATMSPDLAKMLINGSVAELHFSDGRVVYAKPADAPDAFRPTGREHEVDVRLVPEGPIANEALGTPVSIRVVNATAMKLKNRVTRLINQIPGQV
jgi:mannuronan synthase